MSGRSHQQRVRSPLVQPASPKPWCGRHTPPHAQEQCRSSWARRDPRRALSAPQSPPRGRYTPQRRPASRRGWQPCARPRPSAQEIGCTARARSTRRRRAASGRCCPPRANPQESIPSRLAQSIPARRHGRHTPPRAPVWLGCRSCAH